MTIDNLMEIAMALIFGVPMAAGVYWGWKFASLSYYEEKLKLEQKYRTDDLKGLK